GPAGAMERRVRRAALRREPVVLGTAAAPYEPPARGESLLRPLLPLADGLEVAVTTATPRILGELELLAELDRRHSVTVRVTAPVPAVLDPGPRLRAAHSLAAEGITTVLLLVPAKAGCEEELRYFLEQAARRRSTTWRSTPPASAAPTGLPCGPPSGGCGWSMGFLAGWRG